VVEGVHPLSEDKRQARELWNANPCGAGGGPEAFAPGSAEFFAAVRRERYEVSDPWIRRAVDFRAFSGKRLLEIGYGMGTDLLEFARSGAEVHGVDLTPGHHRLAVENFRLSGLTADLRLADAAHLEYPDASFDVVYSLGVLHHTPDIEACVAEARRVLRPGGLFIVGLYHRWSAFHLANLVLYHGVVRGDLRRLGYRGLMARVERGADGLESRPLVLTYSRRGVRRLLRDFSSARTSVHHFRNDHVPLLGARFPKRWEPALESTLGWYVVGHAVK
jgi:SAM-dependent methyltransferase